MFKIWNRKKLIRKLGIFYNSKIVKYAFLYTVAILLLFFFSNKINGFILDHLLFDKKSLLSVNKFLIVLVFLFVLFYIFYKLFLKKYRPSDGLLNAFLLISIFYVITRFTDYKEGWEYINFYSNTIKYIDLLGSLVTGASLILLYLLLVDNTRVVNSMTPFIGDDPISNSKDDKLGYQARAKKIVSYLKKCYFEKSFTVGIVGPWGNGKSSLIHLIELELENQELNETISLKFLPYLNHNESEIISDFFLQLSTEIRKYSGQLSNQFISYSDKLIKFYDTKNIADFFKSTSNIFPKTSAYQSYLEIDKTLKKLNKRFVVFIDDLDRLSNKEILQVLKLVRNTANFSNFIFIIALDKDYVLETLLSNNDISDHSFVDKFFQLEVYLPEIDKRELKIELIELLKNSSVLSKSNFMSEIEATITNNKTNLFDDYIHNYRGVKRLANQIIFDYPSLPDKLNLTDFLNFTYLKMSFPSAIKFLNKNWESIMPYNSKTNLYELSLVKEDKNGQSRAFDVLSHMKNTIFFDSNSGTLVDYKQYEISENIEPKISIENETYLSKQQNLLLVKTLIILFGKENQAESHTSIKFENNLRKLLQQKTQEDDFTESKFEGMFNFENDFAKLKDSLNDNHANNILNRLAFFNTVEKSKLLKAILILLIIYDNAEKYNTHTSSVWSVLVSLIGRNIKIQKNNLEVWDNDTKQEIWEYIESKYFNQNFSLVGKIRLLSNISQSRVKLGFEDWGTTESDLKRLSLNLYKQLLTLKHHNLWSINDYSFYHAYHDVSKFHSKQEINPLTIDFWKKNDIHLLCAQMVENDAWTIKMLKISDFTTKLFESKSDFVDFIESNLPNPTTPELLEYMDFLKLRSYANFYQYTRFEFTDFEKVNIRLQQVIDSHNMKHDDFEDVAQVVIKSSNDQIGNILTRDINYLRMEGLIKTRYYSHLSHTYFFFDVNTAHIHAFKSQIFQNFISKLKDENYDYQVSKDKKVITIENNLDTIERISVQPKEYDD